MPNYNPYFSNVVKPSEGGGRRGGSLAGKIIGGIAQAHRAAINHEYASDLIRQRTIGEIVAHAAKAGITSEAENTDMENRREHYKTLTNDIHSHLSPEERTAAGIGDIDPFLVGGKDFQQLGQSRVGRIKPTEQPANPNPTANPEDAMDTSRSNDDSSFTDDHDEFTDDHDDTPPTPPGPTADTGPDQPVKATRSRKKSAATPKKDTSTTTALSSQSISSDIANANKVGE